MFSFQVCLDVFLKNGCKGSAFSCNSIIIRQKNALLPLFLLIYDYFCGREHTFSVLRT